MTASFPINLDFASYLTYDPRGTSEEAKKSRYYTYSVKQDGTTHDVRTIDSIVASIPGRLEQFPFFAKFLNPGVTVIPMPRSAPLQPGALWVPKRICDSLVAHGLAHETLACVERVKAVEKSSTAGTRRPKPEDHFESIRIHLDTSLPFITDITLVDDVLTRGSTFVGIYPHIRKAFPSANIRCFAVISTRGLGNFVQILEPVQGVITYVDGTLDRKP
jgi:hypothetical protein